jgi:hypothetical protein
MKRFAPLLCVICLAACSKAPAPEAAPAAAATARVATPWDDMEKAKQRAIDAQKATEEHAKKEQQQLDAAQQ